MKADIKEITYSKHGEKSLTRHLLYGRNLNQKHSNMQAEVLTNSSPRIVSPNPFSETTTFSFAKEGDYHIRIYDISGRQVDESFFTGRQFIYKSSKIDHGVYYYEVRSNSYERRDETSFARGILIKH